MYYLPSSNLLENHKSNLLHTCDSIKLILLRFVVRKGNGRSDLGPFLDHQITAWVIIHPD